MIILDESCNSLVETVQTLADVRVFRRSGGYLSDVRRAVEELKRLCSAPENAPPCIIVAASFGGFAALLLAAEHRELLEGLILLDPSHPQQGPAVLRALQPLGADVAPAIAEFRTFITGFGRVWEEGCRDVSRIDTLGDLPLVVLAAGNPEAPAEIPAEIYQTLVVDRHAMLSAYAQLSTRGQFRVVPGVGHEVGKHAPHVVRAAIFEMLKASGSPGVRSDSG